MHPYLTEEQYKSLKEALERRRGELLGDIRAELRKTDQEHFIDLAQAVHDRGDESVAYLLSDIDLAVIHAHVEQVRDIEAALLRMATGNFGICSDCGEEIGYPRLTAYPVAKRCLGCQERYELMHVKQTGPSI